MAKLKIAIDGPAGAGKSTVAQRLASALGYVYIDTGAMYRAATWKLLHEGLLDAPEPAIAAAIAGMRLVFEPGTPQRVFVDGTEVTSAIRAKDVTGRVSGVAAMPGVRRILTAQQQAMGRGGGVVLDGRDIGTAVFPDAELKVFLTASTRERTRRRHAELAQKGQAVDFDALEAEIAARDRADAEREHAPLVAAPDAVHLDTDPLGPEEVVAELLRLARAAGA